jgi:CRISPR type III-B/RAMP module RAMP protein Cmr6
MKLNSSEYIFPKKDFENLPNIIRERAGKPLNLGLYFDKYIRWSVENGKTKSKLQDQQIFFKNFAFGNGFRGTVPDEVIPKKEYEIYFQRFTLLKESIKSQGYICQEFCAKILWRLCVGLGAESVYETSINLHRNYAVPIIPGSAIKGCVKAYLRKTGKEAEAVIKEIFGDTKHRGKVIFFDAMPKFSGNLIRLDIMNVHYPDYYQKGVSPGDWMDPTPIPFLVVENAEYQFSVASKHANLAEKASFSLKAALKDVGIGAKTSAGYGYFTI